MSTSMSFVSWGKSAHAFLTDVFSGHRIVFHHVPKCGGTSVGRALRGSYILSQSTITPEESTKAFMACFSRTNPERSIMSVQEYREMALLYLLYSDVRCVAAHVPFSQVAHEVFHDRYLFCTVLREPVERFVSHFLWSYKRPNAHNAIGVEMKEFLTSERARALGATYARYFCGRPSVKLWDATESVEAAINNLRRLDHVGFVDEMEQVQDALRRLTGKRLRIGRENIGMKSSIRQEIMDGPLRHRIADVCAPDREIWATIQDIRSRKN